MRSVPKGINFPKWIQLWKYSLTRRALKRRIDIVWLMQNLDRFSTITEITGFSEKKLDDMFREMKKRYPSPDAFMEKFGINMEEVIGALMLSKSTFEAVTILLFKKRKIQAPAKDFALLYMFVDIVNTALAEWIDSFVMDAQKVAKDKQNIMFG